MNQCYNPKNNELCENKAEIRITQHNDNGLDISLPVCFECANELLPDKYTIEKE